MYRQHQFYGCGMVAFGIGLLLGLWIGSGFWAHCCGFALIFLGGRMFCRK